MTDLLLVMGANDRASKEDLEKVFTKVKRAVACADWLMFDAATVSVW